MAQLAVVPIIHKLDHLKSGHFCSDFKWFLTKWRPYSVDLNNKHQKNKLLLVRYSDVWYSNGLPGILIIEWMLSLWISFETNIHCYFGMEY